MKVKTYISPVTDRKMDESEIWSLDKLITQFMNLKDNMLAYKPIKHQRQKSMEKLEKNQKEKFSFTPSLIANQNQDKQESKHKRTKSSNFFENKVPSMLIKEKLRYQILDEMKKEKEESVKSSLYFIGIKAVHLQSKNKQEEKLIKS